MKQNSYQKISFDDFERRTSLEAFASLDNPWVGCTTLLDVKPLVLHSRRAGESFGQHLMHATLKAANQTEAMRLRLFEDHVRLYDSIGCGPTYLYNNRVLFTHVEFMEDFDLFLKHVEETRVKTIRIYDETGRVPALTTPRDDLIYFSIVPWIHFTSISSPVNYGEKAGSIPRITIGKWEEFGDRYQLPVSIEVHHGLMDGLQMGEFFQRLQQEFHGYSALYG